MDATLGPSEDIRDLVTHLDELIQQGHCLKSHGPSNVAGVRWHHHQFVIKRYNHRSWLHTLRYTCKGSRARRCYRQAQRLSHTRLQTPAVLGFVEQRRHGLLWRSYLITTWIEAPLLGRLWQQPDQSPIPFDDLIQQLADMLNHLALHRITHGDLKHTNLCITPTGPVLIDLDAMIFHRLTLSYRLYRKKDLNRFLMDLPHAHHRALLNRLKND